MKNFVSQPAWALLIAAVVLVGSAHAGAPSSEVGNPSVASKAKKSTAKKSAQAKFVPGSEETAGARSSRLRRECRGRVNAGACAGYTY